MKHYKQFRIVKAVLDTVLLALAVACVAMMAYELYMTMPVFD